MRISSVLIFALVAAGCKGDEKPATTAPDESAKVVAEEAPAAPDKGWTAAKTAAQFEKCEGAWIAVNEATLLDCYSDKFVGRTADTLLPFPDLLGGEAQVKDAKDFQAYFDAKVETPLRVAAKTRGAQIFITDGMTTDGFPVKNGQNKKVRYVSAKFSKLTSTGVLESELYFADQASFGRQTGIWEAPIPSAPIPDFGEPVVVVAEANATESKNLEVVRQASAAFLARDLDKAVSLIAEPSKGWEPLGAGVAATRADRKKAMEGGLAAAKEMGESVIEEFAAGDWVVRLLKSKFVVSDSGLPTFPKSAGKTIEHHELQFYRLKDGLISERYVFYNSLAAQAQAGIFDPAVVTKVVEAVAREQKETEAKAKSKD